MSAPGFGTILLFMESRVNADRVCETCGATGAGKFCAECGTPFAADAAEAADARRLLRADAADTVGVDRRIIATFRDLLLHPVRIIGSYLRGERRYLPPLKVFFTLGGLYMLALSFVQPYRFDAGTLRERGVREVDAVRMEAKIRERGMPLELFNERFESRLNTLGPIATALALLPMVVLLRLFDRRRSWHDHLIFMLGASNAVWLASLLVLPLALLSTALHQLVLFLAMYVYLGIAFFAFYPGGTRLRTTLRFAVFAIVDLVVSMLLGTALMVAVYASVLLV